MRSLDVVSTKQKPLAHRRLHVARVAKPQLGVQRPEIQVPFTIIGAGRLGTAIANMGDGNDVLIDVGDNTDILPGGPILITTRTDALDNALARVPENRRHDLVFLQNGMLEPWLESKGLLDCTQVLVFFSVASKGGEIRDGVTEENPEGLTAVWGPHSRAIADRFHRGGVTCQIMSREAFRCRMLEKLIWLCAFMLVGEKYHSHEMYTVGQVEAEHNDEVSDILVELAHAGEEALGVDLEPGYVKRLCAYSRTLADVPAQVHEFRWRNGWFAEMSKKTPIFQPDPLPLHSKALVEVVNQELSGYMRKVDWS